MKEKKNFYDFHTIERRKDIFNNLDQFASFYDSMLKKNEYVYRRPLITSSSSNVKIKDHDGNTKEMIMMGSNNYLDFANDPDVVKAAKDALKKYGYGSGSVALLAGTFEIHQQLEEQIARFYERESTAIFPTGYSANVGAISALTQEKDLIILDMYAHASIVDGTKLSNATVKFFKHNDMEHLENILRRIRDRFDGVLIAVDGVFSMDGDLCHLEKLLKLKQKYNARLLIDEAHAVGIIGSSGRGTEEHFGLIGEVDIITGTLSKAPAGLGGYLTGSKSLVEYVRHFASSYIFSTALPPSVVGGLIKVFSIMENDRSRMNMLRKNIELFTGKLKALGFNIGQTITAIIPVIIGDDEKTKRISHELAQKGIFSSAVVFPAVRKTQSRIRFSLMSSHTKEEIDFVLNELELLGKKYGVIQ